MSRMKYPTRYRLMNRMRFSPADADDERGATIEPARFLAAVVVLRPFLAVADRSEPIGANAPARQVVADGRRAPLTQRQVVLGRADVARVSFDLDPQVRILLQR